jgi:hypothetical protein
MMYTFIKASRLRRWLSRPDAPEVLKQIKDLLDKKYAKHNEISDPGANLSHPAEDSSPEAKTGPVPDDLRPILQNTDQVTLHARYKHNGVIYA